MAGGLLDLNDPSDGWNIDPATLAQMASAAGTPTWTPGDASSSGDAPADATIAATDAQPAPAVPAAPPATMADTGGGFWHSLASGIGDAGLALGGGIDPSITGDAASIAGRRALLNFGLTMLANSGPSYTPRNFGEILASGLSAANQSNIQTEQTHLKAQQLAATYALKAGQMRIQEYLAGMKGTKEGQEIAAKSNISKLAAGGAGAPAAGTTPAPDGTVAAPAAGDTGRLAPPDGAYGQGGPDTTPVPDEYLPYFQEASARTGIPVDVLIAQTRQESSFNPTNRGKSGEIGLAQVMPSTALAPGAGVAPVDPAKLTDARTAINFQADYLRSKIPAGMNPSDPAALRYALAGYNGGGDKDYVAHVTRYLPPPATRTQVAGPGAGTPGATMAAPVAPAPSSGVVSPAPNSTALSPATTAAPIFETLPPAVLPDVAARKADIEDTYKRQMQIAVASGDKTQMAKATQDRLDNLAKLNQDVTAARAAAQTALIDHNAKIAEQQRTIAADAARNAATNQTQKDIEATKAAAAENLARIQAGQNWHQKLQEQAATDANENTLKPMSALAMKSHQMNLSLAQMTPLLANLPPGGGALGFTLSEHPDLAPLFAQAGIINDKQSDTVRLINGLVSDVAAQMKPVGLGAQREYEWNGFKAQLPSMLTTADGQRKAVAMLMNFNNRIQDESSWMNNYFTRQVPDTSPNAQPGATVPAHNLETTGAKSAQQLMDGETKDGGLGPIVPSYAGPLSGAGQAQWEQALPPGKPYYKTWAVPDPKNPKQPLRDANGAPVTTKTLEYRPW